MAWSRGVGEESLRLPLTAHSAAAENCRRPMLKGLTLVASCAAVALTLAVGGLSLPRPRAALAPPRLGASVEQAGRGSLEGRVLVEASGGEQLLQSETKVPVVLFGMAGCPFTRAFIEGPISEMLATSMDIVDFELHPFGNCYYPTERCGGSADGLPFASYFKGYNSAVRQCFDEVCGKSAADRPSDCFTGPLVSQHGAADGMVTTAWACAKSMAGKAAAKYMPLVECTSRSFLSIVSPAAFGDVVGAGGVRDGCEGQGVVGRRGHGDADALGRAARVDRRRGSRRHPLRRLR